MWNFKDKVVVVTGGAQGIGCCGWKLEVYNRQKYEGYEKKKAIRSNMSENFPYPNI